MTVQASPLQQVIALEEIEELLLQQHNRMADFFQDCKSGHEHIFSKLHGYQQNYLGCNPKGAILNSSDVSALQGALPPTNGNGDCEELKKGLHCTSSQASLRVSAHLGAPLAYEPAYNPSTMTLKTIQTWSKELELDDLRDQQAAEALCSSSDGREPTPSFSSSSCRGRLGNLMHSYCFETFVALAIFANAISIGVETQYQSMYPYDKLPVGYKIVGWFFGVLFLVEVSLRIVSQGIMFFKNRYWVWNVFDMCCVLCSLFEIMIDLLHSGLGLQNTSILRIARIARTMRLSRTLRITSVVRFVSALEILVQSIIATLKSLMWALALMCLIVYIYAIFFTQATTSHLMETGAEQEHPELVEFWGTLTTSMATLYQSVTGGISWREPALPLSNMSSVYLWTFLGYVSFTYFAVLNVVTGVFCNSAIENARREPDMVVESLLSDQRWFEKHLEQLFRSLDKDKSGRVNIRELEKSLKDDVMRAWFAAMGLQIHDAWTLFKLVDEDRSHDVSVHEFVARCMQLRGGARSIDLELLRQEQRMMMKKILQMACSIEADLRFNQEQSKADLQHVEQQLTRQAVNKDIPHKDSSTSMSPVSFPQVTLQDVPMPTSSVGSLDISELSPMEVPASKGTVSFSQAHAVQIGQKVGERSL